MDKGKASTAIGAVLLGSGFAMGTVGPWLAENEYSKAVAVGGMIFAAVALVFIFIGERHAVTKRKSRRID